jgi:cardiolipin synthase
MTWIDWFMQGGRILLVLATVAIALLASGHAIIWKRDSRAALLWIVLIWMLPLIGSLLYVVAGINRIKRQAVAKKDELKHLHTARALEEPGHMVDELPEERLTALLPAGSSHLTAIARTTSAVLRRRLVPGNQVEVLVNGDAAYPAMIGAIAQAQHTVTLASYIFDRDEAGLAFARALGDAVRRGVEVRVLLDAMGMRYSWPTILRELRREAVPCARFLPAFPLRRLPSMNLRNHRKLLVVDGQIGFTGGMNIRVGHWLEKNPAHPVRDLHFRLSGPVVAHLQEVFADDWYFTTHEELRGEAWFPSLEPCGPVTARGISDGPDEDFEILRWTILAALAAAKSSVRIATPYFLPEPTIVSALNLAAMRGVSVDILLPAAGNLPFVQWASTAQWWQLLQRGCRIWLSAPPFDHSKLLVVDDCWTLLGSTNWDPRSLRLNFEFNVECYDPALAQILVRWFDEQLARSHQVTLAEVDARSLTIRLRDGIARLFSPYL